MQVEVWVGNRIGCSGEQSHLQPARPHSSTHCPSGACSGVFPFPASVFTIRWPQQLTLASMGRDCDQVYTAYSELVPFRLREGVSVSRLAPRSVGPCHTFTRRQFLRADCDQEDNCQEHPGDTTSGRV